MCVAIIKPANFTFDNDDIEAFWHQNPDGFGVMWADDSTIHSHRALPASAKDAVKLYNELVPHDKECVLHYRFATHGSKTLKNTHPFSISDDLYMVHNGVLAETSLGLKCGKGTDTMAYVRQFIRPMLSHAKDPLELAHSPEFRAVIGEHIGSNKFVFLDKAGLISVVNERLGKYIDRGGLKIWVSNTNWDTPQYYKLPAWDTSRKADAWTWRDEEVETTLLTSSPPHGEEVTQFLFDVDTVFGERNALVESYLDDYALIDYFYDDEVGGDQAWQVLDYLREGAIDIDTFVDIVVGAAVLESFEPVAA